MKSGYNVNTGAYDNYRARADMLRSGADMHLVMTSVRDGEKILRLYKEALSPESLCVRFFDPRQGNWSLYDPQTIMQQMASVGHLDVIRDNPANEPSLMRDRQRVDKEFVDWCLQVLHYANMTGQTIAIGAFAVGWPHESKIWDGTYDRLIEVVVTGNHYISVHEYAPGIPGPGDVLPANSLDQPETLWRRLQEKTWPLDDHYNYVRRSDRWIIRARELGFDDPRIIITESFADNISIVTDAHRQRYGLPEYGNDLRGPLSWAKFYEEVFPGLSFEQAVYKILRYRREVIYNKPHIVSDCIYTLSDIPEWRSWNMGDHRFDNIRGTLLPKINELDVMEIPPMSEPAPQLEWQIGTFNFENVNMRRNPTQNSSIITTLRGVKSGRLCVNVAQAAEGYQWRQVDIDSVGQGWCVEYNLNAPSVKFFTFQEDIVSAPDPTVPDIPAPEPTTDNIEKQKQRKLARAVILALVAIASAIALYFGINFNPAVPSLDATPTQEVLSLTPN